MSGSLRLWYIRTLRWPKYLADLSDQLYDKQESLSPFFIIFPSRVSGRGYWIGHVCVSVYLCVCVFVCQRSHGWTVSTTDLKFGRNIDSDNISDKFEGQGHRSKVNVAIWKNVIFRLFSYGMTYVHCTELFCHDTWRHVTSRNDVMTSRDVTAWCLDILWRLLGKNTDKEGTSREGASTLRRFHV